MNVANNIPKEKIAQVDIIIKSLAAAIKSSLMYVSSHPSRFTSIDSLLNAIENWFKYEDSLVIVIGRDSLAIGDVNVSVNEATYKEFARHLFDRGITSMNIKKRVDSVALMDLLDVIKRSPDSIISAGGIDALLTDSSASSISIKCGKLEGLTPSGDIKGNEDVDTDTKMGIRLADLVDTFKDQMKEENLPGVTVRLILNILWLENDSAEFEKLSAVIAGLLPDLVRSSDINAVKDIVTFFSDKINVKSVQSDMMRKTSMDVIELVNNSIDTDWLIRLVPDNDMSYLDNIAEIFASKPVSDKNKLIEAYIREIDPFVKDKYLHIFSKMGTNISNEILAKLEKGLDNPKNSKKLFRTLRMIDPEKAQYLAHRFLDNPDPGLRIEALSILRPSGMREMNKVFSLAISDRDDLVRTLAFKVIVNARDWEFIEKLFSFVLKDIRGRRLRLTLVKLCGDYKIEESALRLSRILLKRPVVNTSSRDELRMASATSLMQIGTEEALGYLEKGKNLKREAIKRMCISILDGKESQ